MNSRLVQQSGTMKDLMYSSKNCVTVKEQSPQFDYIFKQLLLVHQEYQVELSQDQQWRTPKIQCNLLCHQLATNVEIEIFTGHPLDYHYVMSVFKEPME